MKFTVNKVQVLLVNYIIHDIIAEYAKIRKMHIIKKRIKII